MSSIPLPENPSLDHLKKQAKTLQSMVRREEAGGLDLVAQFHPRPEHATAIVDFRLTDAQIVVARLYGFKSWAALREHLDVVERFSRNRDPADTPTGQFVRAACLSYDNEGPRERVAWAHARLLEDPTLATTSIAAAATVGDHQHLAAAIADDGSIVHSEHGPHGWPLILYCAYSRISVPGTEWSLLTTLKTLLDAGADANAGYLWRGLVPPFTALTGAIGGGERNESEHPESLAFARLLLEAGADPNDGQALYNRGLAGSPDDGTAHLALLHEFGLGSDVGGPWYERLGSHLTAPEELVYDELEVAALRDLPRRMQWLVGLGLDLDRPVGRSRKTPWEIAEAAGSNSVLEVLAAQR